MRSASLRLAILLGVLSAAVALPVAGQARPAVRTPIAQLVSRAERSPYLWATVNECSTAKSRLEIGIRGEMPALGVPATLSMTIQLQYYAKTEGGFVTLPGATATRQIDLGTYSRNAHQAGASFPFTASPGLLQATVTFTWSSGTTTLGSVARTTTAGHRQAAFGIPAHHSAASCRL